MGFLGRRGRSRPRIGNPNHGRSADSLVAAQDAAEHKRLQRDYGLTAAGFRVKHEDSDQLRRLIQPWQSRSFSYYDQLGEIWYASQFYARMMALLKLYPAKKNADGDWEETDDPRAVDALDRIRDPGGGDGDREGLMSSYGRLMFISGEGYMLCSTDKDTGLEQWECLSTDELRVQSGVYVRYRAPTMAAQTLHEISDDDWTPIEDDEGVVYRLWRRHPRYSMLADAPMKGVLDLCVAEGSLVNTTRGPIPIENVTAEDEVFTWAPDGVGCRPVRRHLDRGIQPVLKIKAGRRTIRATPEHRVLVLRKDQPGKGHSARYECEWVEAGDLQRGDHLVSLDHVPDYGTLQLLPDGVPVDEDVAWLLGQIVGDGHVHGEGVNIAVYNEPRRARIAEIMREWWGLADHPQGGNARFYSRALRNTLTEMGLRVKSHHKRVPAVVLASPPWVKRAFLAGYEEADGHLTKRGWQSLALSSPELACELRGLYIELGENVSNIHIEQRAAVMAMPGGYTTENAKPLHRFQVYYGSRRRGAQGILQAQSAQEQIGGEHFTLATVKSVEPDGETQTFDLEVEGEHNYIADGVVSHNCEELLLLTRAVRARARSRLAGPGILAISEDFSHTPMEATPDEDLAMDPFLSDLKDAMISPISNEGAASAVVPIVIRGTTEAVQNGIKHIQIMDPTQLYPETGLRYECIKRIALGLDMPPEILLGMTDANHWTGWLVDDQTWKAHGQPAANQFVNDMTTSYFLPQLRSEGVADWELYSIQYDATDVINHPDRGKDAADAYDRRAIGKAALREAKGFDEVDAPTPDELNEMIGVAVHDGSIALFGTPKLTTGGVETAPGEIEVAGGGNGNATGGEVEKGPPAEGTGASEEKSGTGGGSGNENTPGGVVGSALEAARFAGAADMMIRRCREVAGNRLRSLANRDAELRAEIEGVRPGEVAHVLGRDRVRALAGSELDLIANARAMLEETLIMWELPAETRSLLMDRMEQHVVRTLYDERPSPLPDRLHSYISGVLAR